MPPKQLLNGDYASVRGGRSGGRSQSKVDTKYSGVVDDYTNAKYGVNTWGWVFYIVEILAALAAIGVGIPFVIFSIWEGDETPRNGWYPLRYSIANTENYSDYDMRLGVMFFSVLIASGGSFLLLQLLALLSWKVSSDPLVSWSPIHKYTYDMQTMSGWYDGLRYAGTFWAPYVAAFILSGTREITSLAFVGLLVIISYLLRINAGLNRTAYREIDGDDEKAELAKSNIRVGAAWNYAMGFSIQLIVFVLLIIQFAFLRSKDVVFDTYAQTFVLFVAIGGFVEYWLVFGMRSSAVLKDLEWTGLAEAPYGFAKLVSLSGLYGDDCLNCFDDNKKGVLLGWISHSISRALEFAIWIVGGICLYKGGVEDIFVA